MIRPLQFNKFNNSTLLYQYLDYLTPYLESLEIKLEQHKYFLNKKLHINIKITDNQIVLFDEVIKATDINDYKAFDTNIYYDLDYYTISKELTLNHIRNDMIKKISRLRFDANHINNGFMRIRNRAYKAKQNKEMLNN